MEKGEERQLRSFGSIQELPESIVRGSFPLISNPAGHYLDLKVIIASGKYDGPTFLVTANIHGDEVTGVVVVHRFIESLSSRLDKMRGRVVAVPSLNPTGFLAGTRYPQFEASDPNRKWPDSRPQWLKEKFKESEDNSDPWTAIQKRSEDNKGPQASAFERIWTAIEALKPDYHVDLHTFSTLSFPFIFLDRVMFDDNEPSAKEEADKLFEKTFGMVSAMGFTVLRERPPRIYIDKKLHRSTSGATLNKLRIPSCTLELGPMDCVSPHCRDSAIISLENVMKWSGMLLSTETTSTTTTTTTTSTTQQQQQQLSPLSPKTTVLKFDGVPHRYLVYPMATTTGVVDYLKEEGQPFKKDEELAVIRNMSGDILETIKAEMDGWMVAWFQGISKYEGDNLGMVAVPDGDTPVVVPWSSLPPSFFK